MESTETETVIADSIKPLATLGLIWDKRNVICCDRKCHKAWGVGRRPKNQLFLPDVSATDPDDIEYLSDTELDEAPRDPGTYEGGQAKPINYTKPNEPPARHNKWCIRECERSVTYPEAEFLRAETVLLPNMSCRLPNKYDRYDASIHAIAVPKTDFIIISTLRGCQ
jgi:hypothetical protein